MSKVMLIDSAHSEEVRVAVVNGEKLERYDFEVPSKVQIKGNIYLAKVVRVEPSLQAAFVDYGGDKHGFLSFSEIHHDYFQIPVEDREDLQEHIQNVMLAHAESSGMSEDHLDSRELAKLRYQFYRRYKIQEVIKKRQIMLVQVTKEERGNKGAALTTYISLAGRYCVLMPNTPKGSGISRKINDPKDRAKLKKIVSDLHIENGSTVIRTAGIGHTKTEIKKDFDYLKKTWDEIRATTLKSTAPCLINEEASIIKRSIRDLYSRDVENIIVEGKEAFQVAKNFVKKFLPSHVKKVKLYDDKRLPIFTKYKISDQINQIYSTRVDLPSGGYLVINATEALIAIDVNSGKATRERNIANTALKTNLEAAVEIARQCRLRDLAGLVVVDFIDMEEKGNNNRVEKCLREALKEDKAKLQIGTISNFGLLEFSRQRLRSSITEANMLICPHCHGTGLMWSKEFVALQILRKIDETCAFRDLIQVNVTVSQNTALYLLNNKRDFIVDIEKRNDVKVIFDVDPEIVPTEFKIDVQEKRLPKIEEDDSTESENSAIEKNRRGKNNLRQKTNFKNLQSVDEITAVDEISAESVEEKKETNAQQTSPDYKNRRKNQRNIKRRGRNNLQENSVDSDNLSEKESSEENTDSKKVFHLDRSERNRDSENAEDTVESKKVFNLNRKHSRNTKKSADAKEESISENLEENSAESQNLEKSVKNRRKNTNNRRDQQKSENKDTKQENVSEILESHNFLKNKKTKRVENRKKDNSAENLSQSNKNLENSDEQSQKISEEKPIEPKEEDLGPPPARPFDFILPLTADSPKSPRGVKESKEMKKKRVGWWQSFLKNDDKNEES